MSTEYKFFDQIVNNYIFENTESQTNLTCQNVVRCAVRLFLKNDTLSERIGLDVTIVVLASPDESSFVLESKGNHIINESVLIPDVLLFELLLVSGSMSN
jgi:hypothetical protein